LRTGGTGSHPQRQVTRRAPQEEAVRQRQEPVEDTKGHPLLRRRLQLEDHDAAEQLEEQER
jgi:hypothetical protein